MAKRPGQRIGDLTDVSKVKLHELLITIFSSQGYLKATSIMKLNDIVNSDVVEEAIKKEIATLSIEVPKDIITNPVFTGEIIKYQGIKGKDLSDTQKNLLIILIKEYVNNLEHEKVEKVMSKIKNPELTTFILLGLEAIKEKNLITI
jgi:hypothetical protein